MLTYEVFYRRNGIRLAQHLRQPPLPLINTFGFPQRSVFHFVADTPLITGPDSNDLFFKDLSKPVLLAQVLDNGDNLGNPRLVSVAIDPLIRAYHMRNPRMRKLTNIEASDRDNMQVLVFNYALIAQRYKYTRSIFASYYRWWNQTAAVWKKAAEVAKLTNRHQFITMKLPKLLPSVGALREGSRDMSAAFAMESRINWAMEDANYEPTAAEALALEDITQTVLKRFPDNESLFILEVWKWLGEARASSLLSVVPDDLLDRINLLVEDSGRWFVLNLGLFNSWRQDPLNKDVKTKQGLPPVEIQKQFLRLMMAVTEIRADGVIDAAQAAVVAIPPVPVMKENLTPAQTKQRDNTTVTLADPRPQDEDKPTATAASFAKDAADPNLDAELATLQDITTQKQESDQTRIEPGSLIPANPPKPESIVETPETRAIATALKQAEDGVMTALQLENFKKLAASYKKLPAPDGSGTMEQFLHIPAEALVIPNSPDIPDIKTVFDKSMLKSSLLVFDKQYIEQVMYKDIANMVMNFQANGMAITGYDVERVTTVTGSFDSINIKVHPINGTPTTWSIKIPVIEEDGTFTANGVKYRLRKQKYDLPIRKIGTYRVQLASYYGKLFLSRSQKRVNDFPTWLRNLIMARALDPLENSIAEMHAGNVFDNTFLCPRIYSILAQGYRGFTVLPVRYPRSFGQAKIVLSFEHTKRAQFVPDGKLESYEQDGRRVVGAAKGSPVVVDPANVFYLAQGEDLTPLGTLEELLDIEMENAPVEIATIKVMGEEIALGVALAYFQGIEELMRGLGTQPRRVPVGTRVQLAPNEFSLVFQDQTWVFNRDEPLTALIMGGFNEYRHGLRKFAAHEFDKQAVYLNILDNGPAGVRYLKELTRLDRLFIDPITRDLLLEMKEPVLFQPLLKRAGELLLTDTHPDELDSAYMRIRGYERIAGAVYTELVAAVRAHEAMQGHGRMPVDLHPYAVWKNISLDASKSLVADINPIENLKQLEAVTYNGNGGRNGRSMTKRTRAYHKNDEGTISEATVDSADVAINTYLSADPQFTSVRGISRRYVRGKTGATALLSTSALLSVGADRDDQY